MLRLSWRLAACFAVLTMLVGCGPGGSSPKGTKVTGVVTIDGQPVEGATVSFVAKSAGGGGAGITDASGRFSLVNGAAPGSYDVTVTKMSGGSTGQPAAQPTSMEEAMKAGLGKGKPGGSGVPSGVEPPKSLLPEKYNSAKTSGLSAEVKAGDKNDFEFKLQK